MNKRIIRCGGGRLDLIQTKILVRLPVKSLLRFKTVCKSWLTLIESSSFIDLHTTTSSSKFGSFITLARVKPSPGNSLVMLAPASESESLVLDNLGECYNKFIVGSCNGLVCLHDRTVNMVSLWNPATKQHRNLPKPIGMAVDRPRHLVAFGLDVETKDYKVLLLTGFPPIYYRPISPIERVCRIQVYSLSTDSWRLVEGITCLPGDPFQYADDVQYVNGSCFFMSHFLRTKHHQPCIPENDRFIFSFDLTKEIITPIQFPDHHRDQNLYLSCLDDKLALFIVKYQPRYADPPNGLFYVDDYTLYKHGKCNSVNKDSWKKLHSFQITVESPLESNKPRGISNDGKFAFLEFNYATGGTNIKLYHFASKEVKQTFPPWSGSMFNRANAYKPSLVSINGGNGAAIEKASRQWKQKQVVQKSVEVMAEGVDGSQLIVDTNGMQKILVPSTSSMEVGESRSAKDGWKTIVNGKEVSQSEVVDMEVVNGQPHTSDHRRDQRKEEIREKGRAPRRSNQLLGFRKLETHAFCRILEMRAQSRILTGSVCYMMKKHERAFSCIRFGCRNQGLQGVATQYSPASHRRIIVDQYGERVCRIQVYRLSTDS